MKRLYIDIETTGLIIYEARIVQLGIIWQVNDFVDEKSILINPTIDIPENSTKIHGITNEYVKDAPLFKDIAPKLKTLFDKADCIIGYNAISYDIPILKYEFLRAGYDIEIKNVIDPYIIWGKMEKKKLKDAYKRFVGDDLEGAHNALNDIRATKKVLENMCKTYSCDMDDLIGL